MRNLIILKQSLNNVLQYRMIAIVSIITPVLSLIQTTFIVREVPQVEYGQYLAVIMISGFFLNLLDINSAKTFLWLGSKAFSRGDKRTFSNLFYLAIVVEIASYCLIFSTLFIFGETIVGFFSNAKIPLIQFRIFLFSLIASIGRGTLTIVPMITSEIRLGSTLELVCVSSKFIVTLIIVCLWNASLNGLVFAALLSTSLSTLYTILFVGRYMHQKKLLTRPAWGLLDIRQYIRYTIQSFSLISLKTLSSKFSQIIATYYLSPEQISVFGIADMAFQAGRGLFSRIANYWQSSFAKMVEHKQYSKLNIKIRKSTFWSYVIWVLVLILIILIGKPVIQIILGPDYAEIYSLAIILCIGYTIVSPLFWMSPLSIALDRPNLLTFGKLIQIAIGSVSTIIFTARFGATGAALGQTMGRVGSEISVFSKLHTLYKREAKNNEKLD